MAYRVLIFRMALAVALLHPALRADDTISRYTDGAKQDADSVAELERKSQKRPDDWKLHATLLGYWSRRGAADPEQAKPARARHLLWLIEHRPDASVLSYPQAATVNLEGHPLADQETFAQAKALWMQHLERASSVTLLHAAVFLSHQDPPAAYEILSRLPSRDRLAQALLGKICAAAYIGALGLDHTSELSLWSDPELPKSALALECKEVIETEEDTDLLAAFVIKAARDGSELYLDGKLDWDYTTFLKDPAQRAARDDPDHALLQAIPGLGLPDRGDTGARIVSISGDEMRMRVLEKVQPIYPLPERMRGITGTAHLLVSIDPNGDVVRIDPVSGPPGLQRAGADAVSKWKYQGLEHRGRPYYVLTGVDVNFTLTPGR